MDSDRNRHAAWLFDGIVERYDLLAQLFSFGQTGRWTRRLVSRLEPKPGDLVLDLCTGTGRVARQMVWRSSSRVVGVDLSAGMLDQAGRRVKRNGLDKRIALVRGRAEGLPFPDGCFDAVCFTYLLRYVDDPQVTLSEIVRVLKPGGHLASLEFGVPPNGMVRGLWFVYTRAVLPAAAGLISPGWREVGKFLGPSICRLYRSHTVGDIREMWMNAGVPDARVERLSLGGAVVMWGTKVGSRDGSLCTAASSPEAGGRR